MKKLKYACIVGIAISILMSMVAALLLVKAVKNDQWANPFPPLFVVIAGILVFGVSLRGYYYVRDHPSVVATGPGEDISIEGTILDIRSVSYSGSVAFQGAPPQAFHDYWLLRSDQNGSKYPVFIDRQYPKFKRVPAEYKKGDRVQIIGPFVTMTFPFDAAMHIFTGSDFEKSYSSGRTRGRIINTREIRKISENDLHDETWSVSQSPPEPASVMDSGINSEALQSAYDKDIVIQGSVIGIGHYKKNIRDTLRKDQYYLLVLDETTKKRFPVFVKKRSYYKHLFIGVADPYQTGDRLRIKGHLVEKAFMNDAAMRILGDSDFGISGSGRKTRGYIVVARDVDKLTIARSHGTAMPAVEMNTLMAESDEQNQPRESIEPPAQKKNGFLGSLGYRHSKAYTDAIAYCDESDIYIQGGILQIDDDYSRGDLVAALSQNNTYWLLQDRDTQKKYAVILNRVTTHFGNLPPEFTEGVNVKVTGPSLMKQYRSRAARNIMRKSDFVTHDSGLATYGYVIIAREVELI